MLLPTVFVCVVLMLVVSYQTEAVTSEQAVQSEREIMLQQELLRQFSLNSEEQSAIAEAAETKLNEERQMEGELSRIDELVSAPNSSVGQHRRFTFTSRQSVDKGRVHRIKVLEVTEAINRKGVPLERRKPLLDAGFGPQVFCDDNCTCDNKTPYRTADGRCNNLHVTRTTWGMASIPMRRWMDPVYGDGVASPRTKGVGGLDLPSARKVSVLVHSSSSTIDQHAKFTYMLMQWGQYTDHDFTSTPQQQIPKGPYGTSAVSCCASTRSSISQTILNKRPECFPISIPPGDHHFNTTCMNFIRSVQVENANCKPAPVEQLNAITAYLDASNVYGSSQEEQNELREFKHGFLKVHPVKTDKLPQGSSTSCNTPFSPNYCFKAGDHRVNENPTLQSMHTIFVREHNRIAKELGKINCHWDDEKLFQEARKIVGAIHQKITYGEYLPIILGPTTMSYYNLNIAPSGYTNSYKNYIDASIRNGFAAAAYRFGHSMIRDHLSSRNTNYAPIGLPHDLLSDVFGDTKKILTTPNREVGPYCRGLAFDRVQKVDRKMSNQVTDHLFTDGTHSFDLAALNIQRGRDHGLPSYLEWRKFCKVGDVVNNFADLSFTHDASAITQLQAAYASVKDIDLFPGALSEKPLPDALVGPTFACLLAKQFKVLKEGDRFWFEEKNDDVSFTLSQLAELRKATLSRVICDNTDTYKIQKNAFVKGTYVHCYFHPRLNLAPWKETIGTWSKWSPWTCHKDGIMRRNRKCVPCNCGCEGPAEESKLCVSPLPCGWSSWGPCVNGVQTRSYNTNCRDAKKKCPYYPPFEQVALEPTRS